jgi:hypothetical protein
MVRTWNEQQDNSRNKTLLLNDNQQAVQKVARALSDDARVHVAKGCGKTVDS